MPAGLTNFWVAYYFLALTLEPRHFGALSGLGLISLAIGNEAAALNAFEAALEVNPHMPGPLEHVKELRQRLRSKSF